MSRQALREEPSGHFLIPGRSLPSGWRAVKDEDAAKIRGKCAPCFQRHPGALVSGSQEARESDGSSRRARSAAAFSATSGLILAAR